MPWLQLHITIGQEHSVRIEQVLEDMGALSITLGDAGDQPLLEPLPGSLPLWDQVRVTGLFDSSRNGEQMVSAVKQALEPLIDYRLSLEILPDRIWERVWLEHFQPLPYGDRLWVCPRGEQAPASAEVVLRLDPGLAFGTGTHPTTALCLHWLDGTVLDGKRVLDYGCGSGILAIAALLLGAAEAVAVDHDPQALQASHENAANNGVLGRLTLAAPGESLIEPVDILLANILSDTLIQLAPELAAMVKPKGRILLSGILQHQGELVAAAFQCYFQMLPPRMMGDWLLLEGVRHRG